MRLNLGCGHYPEEGWVNVDLCRLPGVDVVFDLERCGQHRFPWGRWRLPFADSSVEAIKGEDFLEHITHLLPLMQELWRVAQPGCRAVFSVPWGACDLALDCPTHRRSFHLTSWCMLAQPAWHREYQGYDGDWQVREVEVLVNQDLYGGTEAAERLAHDEEFATRLWREVNSLRNVATEMFGVLEAVKPARPRRVELEERPAVRLVLADPRIHYRHNEQGARSEAEPGLR